MTWAALATFQAKNRPDRITPATTPMARLRVQTTTATVVSITTLDRRGLTVRLRIEPQSKVLTDTIVITATSAAMGINPTMSPSTTTRISRNTPAQRVERRVRAPEIRTLIIDCPIIAQPAMPPRNPVTTFAAPCPAASRFLSLPVSVMSSISWAVISDSSRPTTIRASAVGRMIRRVSRE